MSRPQAYGNLVSDHDPAAADSSFYHYDGRHSTRSLTDSAGTETDSYVYQAFGTQQARTGTSETPFTWKREIGYWHDVDTGDPSSSLYSLRRRTYTAGELFAVSVVDPTREPLRLAEWLEPAP